jgi:hypothetical protein
MGIEEIDGKRSNTSMELNLYPMNMELLESIDDQVFQSLVKDKVNPKPNFLYYTHTDKDGNKFGIIEIFIRKGVDPFRPIKDFGGRRKI